jgi:cytoskeleton protein RodZ
VDAAADNADRAEIASLGRTLAAERERQNLSRADAAQRLHMSAWQIEALEGGDYARLPKGTFLRGFVRNYAKVLGIAPDPVLSLLAEGLPRDPAPGIVVPTQNIRFDPLGERLSSPYAKAGMLAAVVIALAFATMYWWMYIRPTPPGAAPRRGAPHAAQAVPAPVAATPAPAVSAKAEPPVAEPPRVEAAQAAPPKAPVVPAAQPPAPQPAAAVVAGGKTIRLHFNGESWVEIRDARGRIVMQRLNAAGSDAEVSGRPPFAVIVGNAPEVRLYYDGREFDLEPHTTVAVARFTLE